MLAEKHGYLFMSVTDSLREEAKSRGLTVDRENLRMISAEWRRLSGLGILIDRIIETYESMPDRSKYTGIVIASLRNPGEADRIHSLGGVVLWLDGDARVRYDRIQSNSAHRNRSEEDNVTFEQFKADEVKEMNHTQGADEATLSLSKVKAKSDIQIFNNSNDLDLLDKSISEAIGLNN